MNKNEMKDFYELSKMLTYEDVSDLMEYAGSEEEKRFYLSLVDFFLQERQAKIINEEFTI